MKILCFHSIVFSLLLSLSSCGADEVVDCSVVNTDLLNDFEHLDSNDQELVSIITLLNEDLTPEDGADHTYNIGLTAVITLNDMLAADYSTSLRIIIESEVLLLISNSADIQKFYVLNGEDQIILTPADFKDQLQLSNLKIGGTKGCEFLQTQKLPKGLYKITMEVLDKERQIPISGLGSIFTLIE